MDCFVTLSGQMCNHMFQIATAYAHCRRHGLRLRLPSTGQYWNTYMHRCAVHQGAPSVGPWWHEPRFSYSPIPKEARNLKGYFQSAKYFAEFHEEVRELFDLPSPLKVVAAHKHAAILTTLNKDRAIVMHIRRGDYMLPHHIKKHGILGENYYRRALAAAREALGPDVPILVFSDDLRWCHAQSWLVSPYTTFVDEPNGAVSLWLMSQFRHYIISNSTFSWWAVFLGSSASTKGRVWAPDRWFGSEGPQDWDDIYDPSWTKIPVL